MSTIIQRAGNIRLGGREPRLKNWNRYTAFMNEQYMPILMNSKNRFFSRSLNTGKKIMNPKPVYVHVNGNAQAVVAGQVPCMKKRNKNCIPVSQWETFASRRKESANVFKKKQKESLKNLRKIQKVKNKLQNNLLMYANNPNHVPKARITQANLKVLKNQMNANRKTILENMPNVSESEINRLLRRSAYDYIGMLVNMTEKKTKAPRLPKAPKAPKAPVAKRKPMNLPKAPKAPKAPVAKRKPMNLPKAPKAPVNGCVKQTTKKYTSRKSPAYPANKCCGQVLPGNNGVMYLAKSGKTGICRWVKA
jgi:hypothetical protein